MREFYYLSVCMYVLLLLLLCCYKRVVIAQICLLNMIFTTYLGPEICLSFLFLLNVNNKSSHYNIRLLCAIECSNRKYICFVENVAIPRFFPPSHNNNNNNNLSALSSELFKSTTCGGASSVI